MHACINIVTYNIAAFVTCPAAPSCMHIYYLPPLQSLGVSRRFLEQCLRERVMREAGKHGRLHVQEGVVVRDLLWSADRKAVIGGCPEGKGRGGEEKKEPLPFSIK